MAKGAYIGVNNIARKIKKQYIGVNNVARKIKKVYIGVNNVARLFWTASNRVKGSSAWAKTDSGVTINCGFKPAHILIWNETTSNALSNNEFCYIYSNGTHKHASYLVDSDDDYWCWGTDLNFATPQDNGFWFTERRGAWVRNEMGNFYYAAYPADHRVGSGTQTLSSTTSSTRTVTVNVGFKPTCVAIILDGINTQSDDTELFYRLIHIDGNNYGVFCFEDNETGSVNHGSQGSTPITLTSTGFSLSIASDARWYKTLRYIAFE